MKEKLQKFAELIEKHKKEYFAKNFPRNPSMFDRDCVAKIKPGRKYTKVDVGRSGAYMIDSEGNIFGIKGYGVIHRGHYYGTLDTIKEFFWGNYSPVKLPA